jgi:hypothetical protein
MGLVGAIMNQTTKEALVYAHNAHLLMAADYESKSHVYDTDEYDDEWVNCSYHHGIAEGIRIVLDALGYSYTWNDLDVKLNGKWVEFGSISDIVEA